MVLIKVISIFTNFCNKLNQPNTTINSITKFFCIIRKRIKYKFHKDWERNPLGLEQDISCRSKIKIDESSIIGNEEVL